MSDCSKCNRPCIRVGGKCIVALVRIERNLSFKDAWEAITNTTMNNEAPPFVSEQVRNEVAIILNKRHKLIKQSV